VCLAQLCLKDLMLEVLKALSAAHLDFNKFVAITYGEKSKPQDGVVSTAGLAGVVAAATGVLSPLLTGLSGVGVGVACCC